ncbi:MAG: hypothetical protein QMC80_04590 [Thermoplasmatales archaeon]|nr:hypothetical protein [Thermoplasmatales archaeon]
MAGCALTFEVKNICHVVNAVKRKQQKRNLQRKRRDKFGYGARTE